MVFVYFFLGIAEHQHKLTCLLWTTVQFSSQRALSTCAQHSQASTRTGEIKTTLLTLLTKLCHRIPLHWDLQWGTVDAEIKTPPPSPTPHTPLVWAQGSQRFPLSQPCICFARASSLQISAFPVRSSFFSKPLQKKTAKCLVPKRLCLVIWWIVFHPDMTKLVGWELKTNELLTHTGFFPTEARYIQMVGRSGPVCDQ